MGVIYLLLSISVVVALGFFAAFIGAVRNGQYDDAYTPGVRILFEDEVVKASAGSQKKQAESHPILSNKTHS